jgi:hypothetical protein
LEFGHQRDIRSKSPSYVANQASTSHSTLSALLRSDFEQPLRELPTKIVAWRRISEQDAQLDRTLKDYEKVSAKLDKASQKSKSSKTQAFQGELDQLTSSLASLSPMVYTTYQRLDEARLSGLKEVVIRWGTIRGDMATRDGERAERVVASLLGWEAGEEVLAVGRKIGGGRQITPAPASSRRMSAVSNNAQDFSPRPALRANGSSNATPSFGGLKSMLGRKQTIATPNRARSGSEATSTRSRPDPVDETVVTQQLGPVDSEGFSVAPADRHRNPWDGAESPIEEAPRLNLALAPEPIQETEEQRQAALAKMQTVLAPPPSQPTRRATIARGRRDVRNTMFGGLDSVPSPARQSSYNPFDSPGLATPSAIAPAPAINASGLRASLTETVNVLMRNNEVQRVQLNGEIHLSLASTDHTPGPIQLRLTAFEQLEKVAPNPTYLAQVPDRPGEYLLNSEVLANASRQAGDKGTLLFRYQVHVPAGKESNFAPILHSPAFSVKEGETRMILHYKANPHSTLLVQDLTFVAPFAPGPAVSNVQAKPSGTWSPTNRQMNWQVADTEGKIVARFVNEGSLAPQAVQASWRVDGKLCSGLGIEVQGDWQFEQVKKGLASGKYIAETV